MKTEVTCLILSIALILASCSNGNRKNTLNSSKPNADTTQSSPNQEIQKTIKLDDGFEIKVGREEILEEHTTYSLFILMHNGSQLYLDSSLTEYEFGDAQYPIVIPIDKENFEVLVEVNDRPSKNYLKLFRVQQNKLTSTEKLPTFISRAANLDTDKVLEFAGFWDWAETWARTTR
jgi:hypothetical protein